MERRLYHLIAVTAHQLRVEADRQCQEVAGTTAAQAGVLFAIEAGAPISQRDVATELGLAESAVAGMVSRLVPAGLVTRTRSQRDARAWELELTDQGEQVLAAIQTRLQQFNRTLTEGLASEDLDATFRVLAELRERFRGPRRSRPAAGSGTG